ncbi:MAG: VOC family protein [Pirellulales bacterium]
MHVQTYLFYNGRCQEALDFYKQAIGAEVVFLMHYNESPEPCGPLPEGFESKIMHASFRVGDAELMASDGNSTSPAKFDGFSLSLRFKTAEQAERAFNALADGGQVHVPLMTTFFSPKFGMLTDRFGAPWMVLVESANQGC